MGIDTLYCPYFFLNSLDLRITSSFETVFSLFLSRSQIFSLSGVRKGFLPSSRKFCALIFAMIKYIKCLIAEGKKIKLNHFLFAIRTFSNSFRSKTIASKRTNLPLWSNVTATSNPRHPLVNPKNLYKGKSNPEDSLQTENSHSITSSKPVADLIPDSWRRVRLSRVRSYSNLYSMLQKVNPRRTILLWVHTPRELINSSISINIIYQFLIDSNLRKFTFKFKNFKITTINHWKI